MARDELYPVQLQEGIKSDDELACRIGRYAILQELGIFGVKTSIAIAKGDYKGSFNAIVRRKFSNLYGDVRGCDVADIEVAAELLGVFDDVYDYEMREVAEDGA